ncbi:hypothetical protein C9374_001349 [Naegleria lovaniensis]|uniref:phosphatidylinositol 3-kinase n=1 Tax=Naegleria lovaniensis TaxID=51637 RepID=A0AA88GRW7_NAELO|nr:uncharacterized protein C9374_001349 [Naegleria lovaniensis]KAG2387755.1 hypothetical protein C9374_001349 [Naegleria lovaniensis]
MITSSQVPPPLSTEAHQQQEENNHHHGEEQAQYESNTVTSISTSTTNVAPVTTGSSNNSQQQLTDDVSTVADSVMTMGDQALEENNTSLSSQQQTSSSQQQALSAHLDNYNLQYCYNISEIEVQPFQVKIGWLEGDLFKHFSNYYHKYGADDDEYQSLIGCPFSEMIVECQICFEDGTPLCIPSLTSHVVLREGRRQWDEWIHFPIKFNEIPSKAKICFTIYDVYSPTQMVTIGSSCLPLFGKKGRLKSGKYRIPLFPHKSIDEILNEKYSTKACRDELSMVEKFEAKSKQQNILGQSNAIPKNSNLYKFFAGANSQNNTGGNNQANTNSTLAPMSSNSSIIVENSSEGSHTGTTNLAWLDRFTNNRKEMLKEKKFHSSSIETFLNIELPSFDRRVVDFDYLSNTSEEMSYSYFSGFTRFPGLMLPNNVATPKVALVTKAKYAEDTKDHFRSETISTKYQFIDDPEAKQTNLAEEKHLKLSINLSSGLIDTNLKPNATETKKIQKILDYPPLHEMSTEDKSLLWKYRYYLRSNKRALTKFLRCVDWNYLAQQKEAEKLIPQWSEIDTVDALELLSRFFKNVKVVRDYAVKILRKADDAAILDVLLQLVQALRYEVEVNSVKLYESELAQFLLERASVNFHVANNLNWYLAVETEDPKFGEHFLELRHKFFIHLKKNSPLFLEKIIRQGRMVDTLSKIGYHLKGLKISRPEKITIFKKILSAKGEIPIIQSDSKEQLTWNDIFLANISKNYPEEPLPIPLNPEVKVNGLFAEDSTIFKSAQSPLMVPFSDIDGKKYSVIVKIGDDLRQDQLVMQLILLMDKLLKNNGLDLKLTPYSVLAFSPSFGCLECVPNCAAISSVIDKGDIRGWLRKHNPEDEDFHNACQNFVKSCAGYCVITYILGIGDRHLDNVLITHQGHLFHIDFGFILGRDPKPFPPPMKLCKEMVEGMGGSKSEGYIKFKELCVTAYNILRKSAHLILNMFILMVDANIRDIEHGAAADPIRNIMKVQEKFRVDLNDQDANAYMQSIINESEKALFPQLMENIHRWAQYWRS